MSKAIHKPRVIPFEFVLERLQSRDPMVRPMFGCYAIYVGEKLALILRNREDHPHDNGVWLATQEAYHSELKKIFPSMRPIQLLGKKSVWQNIPCVADDFEESVVYACEMVLKNDPRIGKVPSKKETVKKR